MKKDTDNEAFVLRLQERLNQHGAKLEPDGHGGSETQSALDKYFPAIAGNATPPKAIILPVDAGRSARHYQLALKYRGLKEKPGAGTHPDLVPMFALAPKWLDQDDSETAWCGIFRGGVGAQAGTGLPQDHFRAAAWASWGTAVDVSKPQTWKQGDTLVMTRTGGNHVCLLDRVEGSKVWCLGGNQSNAVTIAPFPLARVTAVRR